MKKNPYEDKAHRICPFSQLISKYGEKMPLRISVPCPVQFKNISLGVRKNFKNTLKDSSSKVDFPWELENQIFKKGF